MRECANTSLAKEPESPSSDGFRRKLEIRKTSERSEVFQFLVAMLKNQDDDFRCLAVETLALFDGKRSIDAIRTTLKDPCERIRMRSAWALGFLGCSPTTVDN